MVPNDAAAPFGLAKSGYFSIGHAVAKRADVGALLVHAEAAGAILVLRAVTAC